MSINLEIAIYEEPYQREWREKTAVTLLSIGMSERNICNAVRGQFKRPKDIYNICEAEKIDKATMKEIMALLL